ncbi:hypothetical protein [Streptomyces sp. NPDC093707]|uniref:hypothetical protein n=1 Tax=Streptomyces sp. NPDC093707 TaxID=3154984 RepID=UPI0034507A3A
MRCLSLSWQVAVGGDIAYGVEDALSAVVVHGLPGAFGEFRAPGRGGQQVVYARRPP